MASQFGTLTEDGETEAVKIVGNFGGWGHFSGDFGGGSITIWFLGLDNEWHALANSEKSAPDDFQIETPHGVIVKGILTDSADPSIYWQLHSARIL